MKLVELECENCGAALKVEEGSNTVNCPYCKATYKIDDEAKHVKYDDMEKSGYEFEKGRIKAQKEHISNRTVNVDSRFPKLAVIPFFMVLILMAVMLVRFGINRNNMLNNSSSSSSGSVSEEKEKRDLESEIYSFNWRYSSGKKAGAFVKSDLNNVINSNRTNKERFITVRFNDIETQDSEEILSIIDQLETHKEYDVLLDYDEEGFITVMTIK